MRCRRCGMLASALVGLVALSGSAEEFVAGYAELDITPRQPMPMWGYGDRHADLSEGVRDPLLARAIVLGVGDDRLAIVGMDLGRAPTRWMMPAIREAVQARAGIGHVMIAGSHTHHGPVIELQDQPGKGQGVYDDAVAYAQALPGRLTEVICSAAANVHPARMGWASTEVDINRNRHSKIEPIPVDRELTVVRFDDLEGRPIAVLANFAAHPTNLPADDLRFSAEYPGQMAAYVAAELGPCVFMQGAAGDLSCRKTLTTKSIESFGRALGKAAVKLARSIETKVPETPSIKVMDNEFTFEARLDLTNPFLRTMFQTAFFPELLSALDEMDGNALRAPMTTALIHGQLALVTGPGEFYCAHAIRLKERSRAAETLFFGYCNGHNMYYPTIEAAAEGGYGADATVAWVELGAGERMMDQALINIYTLLGSYKPLLSVLAGE